jgi:hypothetical protein
MKRGPFTASFEVLQKATGKNVTAQEANSISKFCCVHIELLFYCEN